MSIPLDFKSVARMKSYINRFHFLNVVGDHLRSTESRACAVASLSLLDSLFNMEDLLIPTSSLNDLFPCEA